MLDHMEHIATLVGWEHVAIGSDWPMQHGRSSLERLNRLEQRIGFPPEHRIDWMRTLVGFERDRDLPQLARGLVARGCADDQVRECVRQTFLRGFEDICV